MMGNLFQINVDYLQILNEIEETGGEITPELAERLLITQDNLENKVKSYYHIKKYLEAEIEMIKDEIERLASKKKTRENVIKRLKDNVNIALNLFGDFTKSGNRQFKFTDLTVYNSPTESLEVAKEFNDPDYTYLDITIPIRLNRVDSTISNGKLVVDLSTEKTQKALDPIIEYAETLGAQTDLSNFSTVNEEIKNALKDGKVIDGAKLVPGFKVTFK